MTVSDPSCVTMVGFALCPRTKAPQEGTPSPMLPAYCLSFCPCPTRSCLVVRLTTFPASSNCCVGGLHHEFETDGKTCNTTSTLVVHTYSKNSTVHCIIRHKGLEGRKLVAPFQFEDLGKKDVFLSSLIWLNVSLLSSLASLLLR